VNPTFLLGGELEVRRLGFGAMRIVGDRADGVRVVRRAVELGVTLIDTADIYGAGASEEIVAEALHPYPEGVVIATKGGLGYGLQERIRDARPERLREACEASLRRLKLERIDLYQLHRHDPEVPIEESVGALEQLRHEGKRPARRTASASCRGTRSARGCASRPSSCAGCSTARR
jgi:aryl-alcohol dehydrogenase-like predicted oxidoreductase